MFGLIDCQPILGYDNTWLAADFRFQCNDWAYWTYFFIAVYTVITFSIGLPVYYLVTLRRRRHKLDEAKAVVMKRYQAWRAHLQRAADLRIPEEDMAGAEELVKVDSDILFMHTQYQRFRGEWDAFEFIYDDYKVEYYYWELVEIIRKQMIVAFATLLSIYEGGWDIVFGCGVSFVFYSLHCSALPYVEARENFIKGGEIGTTYLTLLLILIRKLQTGTAEMSAELLGTLVTGNMALFLLVIVISVVWNFRAGLEELEAMKEEAEGEAEGSSDKIDIYAVFFAVKLVNKCVRNRLYKRYHWDQASSIGGDSLLSSQAASSRSGSGARSRSSFGGVEDDDDDEEGAGMLMQPHVRDRWRRLQDKLMLIEGLPEPDFSSQDSEMGLLSEDTASLLDELFADPTDEDASELASDDSFASIDGEGSMQQQAANRGGQPGTNPRSGAIFSEEGVGIDRVDWNS